MRPLHSFIDVVHCIVIFNSIGLSLFSILSVVATRDLGSFSLHIYLYLHRDTKKVYKKLSKHCSLVMTSLCTIWSTVIDFIALHGSHGANVSNVFEILKISENLQLCKAIVFQIFSGKFCCFYLLERSSSGSCSKKLLSSSDHYKDFNTQMDFNTTLCVANVSLSWKAFGFESYQDIPDSQSPMLMSVLELLGIAREKGCVNTEISLLLGIPKIYSVVDRLIYCGCVVKQMIIPIGRSGNSRVKTRSVVFHLKRFASQYDPAADLVSIEADDSMRQNINKYLIRLGLKLGFVLVGFLGLGFGFG
jgi:hypothetical protein